ncbi:alpha-glucuronidase family glycosyl hydrolase [Xanthomonas rydalmerensis]|uniref:Xylan alpha-1,2-glucuronidase n=2 Tax=Xanthomonas rydalmerensis TaxID=3046274 RepID=A0ABZ0JSN2_9XANT|nr:alpha-glucuronidase family glycosyl hydrolase [Xanthomonas sp. DM-2023]WOS42864.1 alpha-glucuronidase family glycosyl hydrolase [Xanthomonas sp. DM-2023]WOS47051.1 alpha-glucuronidase family glycosyl hydrolase [Xanthomonas sp. DM-2023]WOS51230.1 alpha-glucuronidase family glycosyl hydrolase [Xanthomonas sp. DM-2023]WOS55411.1 alpha-glucuronidase family glycosyl hydrolase [Xanthomonas sp. DM-2023]WOS59593.1 alpha-glucuronidase family glycosyl hydrolase [Xanthomonas sp. DM-2023]
MACAAMALMVCAGSVHAEDGAALWLRYLPSQGAARTAELDEVVAPEQTPTQRAARDELIRGLTGLLGRAPATRAVATGDHAVVLGTPQSSPALAPFREEIASLGEEGYLLKRARIDGHAVLLVAARRDIGVLYGVFHLLRLLQTGASLDALEVHESPRIQLRVLDHWDDLDGHVERGYAGRSLWDWQSLPEWRDPRYTDYARANASLGINGTVLNNVNANAQSLAPAYLDKAAALADVFRPYGIRVYLSARFSAPIELGGLKTADPLDPAVQRWWRDKVDDIYARIPDFGGFLVKANSEGQPGPQDYGRSHADGANLLADALAPHGGVVMWRAFVYAHDVPVDRAMQAYTEFAGLDGAFRPNVIVQVKNGPIDFQPREPFHPLFGAMPRTPLMLEFQITKEYLGFATHLVYLGPLYEEVLQSDTHARGAGATVADVVDGSLEGHALSGIAGVANIGNDRTWSGSHFDQANWYAFGRLAWNPHRSARAIAAEWAAMTFSPRPEVVQPIVGMMMASREAAVNYMTPLGLHHLMARGHHYGPGPWVDGGPRADWTSVYYHRADRDGIGFDRTARGSNAVSQYAPEVAAVYGDLARVPEPLLLWFHHVPWDHRMASGRPLWDELVGRYSQGVRQVQAMQVTWDGLRGKVDAERHAQVAAFLRIQLREAQWWRDASVAYFQSVSGRPLPPGETAPPHPLAWYQALQFPSAPGDGR